MKILLAVKNPSEELLSLVEGHDADFADEGSFSQRIAEKTYDLVLLEDGIKALTSLKAADPRVEVILFGDGEVDAVEAIKQGASAYFPLPVDTVKLKERIENICELIDIRRETGELEKLLSAKYTFAGVIGRNPHMLDIFNFIRRIAPYYKTVTIMGETGTGKEEISKAIHSTSTVAKYPFVACNCGALVEGLVESELFGHKKGAFTGAVSDKPGLFQAAGEGTIFLDEISALPLSFQPHLLRVLQNGEYRPLGTNRNLKARCRVIAASNRNLADEVTRGTFREDLFYRLTPLIIRIPPLRDRKDDIPLLSRFFIERFARRTEKRISGLSRPAQSVLMSYDWPGNVRELENAIEQAAIFTTEAFIRLDDLPPYISEVTASRPAHAPLSLYDLIKGHIEVVLSQCNGNKTHAAKKLGISRRSFLRKMEKYSIQ